LAMHNVSVLASVGFARANAARIRFHQRSTCPTLATHQKTLIATMLLIRRSKRR
jgi:hypothetical protein